MKTHGIKLGEFLTFTAIVLFIAGSIFYSTGDNNYSQAIVGDNVVWVNFTDTQMEINTRTIDNIYGIQFEFDGVHFTSIQDGGYLKDNGFETSHNEKVVLSFSFQGKHIPPGEHNLITLNTSFLNGKYNVKIKNMVVAGEAGKSLNFKYYDTNLRMETLRTNQ